MDLETTQKIGLAELGIRTDHKILLADLLETTTKIKHAVLNEETSDLDEMMGHRHKLLQQIEGNPLQYLDEETIMIEPLVKQILSADAECVQLAQQKVELFREQLRELNQMKKAMKGYSGKKPKSNGAFIDTKK